MGGEKDHGDGFFSTVVDWSWGRGGFLLAVVAWLFATPVVLLTLSLMVVIGYDVVMVVGIAAVANVAMVDCVVVELASVLSLWMMVWWQSTSSSSCM